ncbi:MAG: protein jag [Candidatus Doudnabacteria bacterium]|nr:protein jag [Candidatus Doudnabacteria bacterium]
MTDYTQVEEIKILADELLKVMGVNAPVSYEESITKGLVLNIGASPDSYLLIGRQGATLHSLQVLLQAMVLKKFPNQPVYFSVDVDDYKMKREWFLKETARAATDQLKKTGRPQALEPMPSYERRIVHAYLQEHNPEVYTESIGQEPYRKIVIRLK